MAGSNEPPEFDLLKDHLAKTAANGMPCDVCGSREWQFGGMVGPMVATYQNGSVNLGPGLAPLLLLMCTKCFQTRQFSVEALRKSASK